MKFNLILILTSLALMFSNACTPEKECKKYLIPETDLEAYNFMNDSTKSLIFTNSKGISHSFQLYRNSSGISNENCNIFELGPNQYEEKKLQLNSNDFPIDITETSKCKFAYSVRRDRYEDSLTKSSLLLGDFRYVFKLKNDKRIKTVEYIDSMDFWMKSIDSFYVFNKNAFNSQIDSSKSYVSEVFWSNKYGLIGYKLNDSSTFMLDTVIKKEP